MPKLSKQSLHIMKLKQLFGLIHRLPKDWVKGECAG